MNFQYLAILILGLIIMNPDTLSAQAEVTNREKIIKDQSGSSDWEKVLERHTDFKRLDHLEIDPVQRHKDRGKKLREPVFGTREYDYYMKKKRLEEYKEELKKTDRLPSGK